MIICFPEDRELKCLNILLGKFEYALRGIEYFVCMRLQLPVSTKTNSFFFLSMSAHYDNHHFIYSIFVSLFFFPRLLFITLIAFIGDEKLSHQLIFQTLKIYFTNNLLTQKRNHNSLKENYSNHSLHLLHFLFHPSTPNISTQPAANKNKRLCIRNSIVPNTKTRSFHHLKFT